MIDAQMYVETDADMRNAQAALVAAQEAVRRCPKGDPNRAQLEVEEAAAEEQWRTAHKAFIACRNG